MRAISKIKFVLFALGILIAFGFTNPTTTTKVGEYYYVIVLKHRSDDKKIYITGLNRYEPSCGKDWETGIKARKAFEIWLVANYNKTNSYYDGDSYGGIIFGKSEKIGNYNDAKRKMDEYIARVKNNNSNVEFVYSTYTYNCGK